MMNTIISVISDCASGLEIRNLSCLEIKELFCLEVKATLLFRRKFLSNFKKTNQQLL